MCGIIGYIGNRDVKTVLLEGLSRLEYRGYDSSGIAIHDGKNIKIEKSVGRLDVLKNQTADEKITGCLGIGHTRWATHGAPSNVNSHPHQSCDGKIVLVHNGIIENYLEIKNKLLENGYTFISETDTEVVANLISYFYKKTDESNNVSKLLNALKMTLDSIRGSYGLAVMCTDEPEHIVAVRKDCPLIVGLGENDNFLASDIPAILPYTRKIFFLNDGEIVDLKKNEVIIYNEDLRPIKKDEFLVDWDMESAEKADYPHFMLKEIFEQPNVIQNTLHGRIHDDFIDLGDIKLSKEEIQNFDSIHFVACGTAYYACLVGKALIENWARINVSAEVASEFRYKNPLVTDKSLVVVVSQSGETADTLAALRLAKKKGARILGIVNVLGSSIAREADDLYLTLAGPEIAVASTKVYSAQVVAMFILTLHIAKELGKISGNELESLKNEIAELPDKISEILTQSEEIKKLAEKYKNSKNIFYIGRGVDCLVAMEAALKMKEIAYIHSENYAAGELKHGPIALIEDSTLIVGILTQDNLFEKTVSNIKECRARGASALVVTCQDSDELASFSEDAIIIPETNVMFSSLLANIPLQLFAYYVAVGLGNDVDKPRNLAKSVTVE